MIDAKEAATISQEINDKANKLIDDLTFKALEAANNGETSVSVDLHKVNSTIRRIAVDHLKDVLGYGVGSTFRDVYTLYWSGYSEDIESNSKFVDSNTCFIIAMSVQSTAENILRILNDKVVYCAENGDHEVSFKTKWYNGDAVKAACETLLSLGYNVECNGDYVIVS